MSSPKQKTTYYPVTSDSDPVVCHGCQQPLSWFHDVLDNAPEPLSSVGEGADLELYCPTCQYHYMACAVCLVDKEGILDEGYCRDIIGRLPSGLQHVQLMQCLGHEGYRHGRKGTDHPYDGTVIRLAYGSKLAQIMRRYLGGKELCDMSLQDIASFDIWTLKTDGYLDVKRDIHRLR